MAKNVFVKPICLLVRKKAMEKGKRTFAKHREHGAVAK